MVINPLRMVEVIFLCNKYQWVNIHMVYMIYMEYMCTCVQTMYMYQWVYIHMVYMIYMVYTCVHFFFQCICTSVRIYTYGIYDIYGT